MNGISLVTPLIRSLTLSKLTGAEVFLKMEAFQPTGSFKARGIGHLAQAEVHAGKKRLVASSGGNAGLAAAYAGAHLGVPVTVVVPEATGARARDLIASHGATVIVHGASWREAHEYAQTLLGDGDAAYIHPFDHPLIWAGHARMVEEIADDLEAAPDLIVLSVGGGGLLAGVCEGMARVGWDAVRLLAVETEGAASFDAARKADELVTLSEITSVAITLGAKRVAAQALAWSKKHPMTNIVVSDCSAVEACYQFLDDHRVLVEPACGAALAPVYEMHDAIRSAKRIVVIVCGGSGVTLTGLQEMRAKCALSRLC